MYNKGLPEQSEYGIVKFYKGRYISYYVYNILLGKKVQYTRGLDKNIKTNEQLIQVLKQYNLLCSKEFNCYKGYLKAKDMVASGELYEDVFDKFYKIYPFPDETYDYGFRELLTNVTKDFGEEVLYIGTKFKFIDDITISKNKIKIVKGSNGKCLITTLSKSSLVSKIKIDLYKYYELKNTINSSVANKYLKTRNIPIKGITSDLLDSLEDSFIGSNKEIKITEDLTIKVKKDLLKDKLKMEAFLINLVNYIINILSVELPKYKTDNTIYEDYYYIRVYEDSVDNLISNISKLEYYIDEVYIYSNEDIVKNNILRLTGNSLYYNKVILDGKLDNNIEVRRDCIEPTNSFKDYNKLLFINEDEIDTDITHLINIEEYNLFQISSIVENIYQVSSSNKINNLFGYKVVGYLNKSIYLDDLIPRVNNILSYKGIMCSLLEYLKLKINE